MMADHGVSTYHRSYSFKITSWIIIIEGALGEGECSISLTDSTTSKGWAKKTNFCEDGESPVEMEVPVTIVRTHAKKLMDANVKDYSQYFPGKYN
eukprot:1076328-Ditylum_brightwellii.AAC.1